MAMLRLPTRQSLGKANLHQGAIGVGIHLKTGMTIDGVHENKKIIEHPDTNEPIAGLQVPDWQEVLCLAAKCSEMTGLGYLGVDIVLDSQRGPLILEINARPGLSIQVANEQGMLPRLKKIEDSGFVHDSLSDKVSFSKENF